MKVNILGAEYEISKKTYEEEPCLKENSWGGYCDGYNKEIILLDLDKTESWDKEEQSTRSISMRESLRHELVHAFLGKAVYGTIAVSMKKDGRETKKWLIG